MEFIVEFDKAIQTLEALHEAAYRLVGIASSQLSADDKNYICRLTLSTEAQRQGWTEETVRSRFLDIVTDENLRRQVAAETKDIKNVIIALAFGALATESDRAEKV